MKYVIIVAGGKGVRMGADLPKQFLEIDGKAILQLTMEKFLEMDRRIHFVVVLPRAYYGYWKSYCSSRGFEPRQTIVGGGLSRFHSVQNAVERIVALEARRAARRAGAAGAAGCGEAAAVSGALAGSVVAVHDGVRPLVSTGLIERAFAAVSGGESEGCGEVFEGGRGAADCGGESVVGGAAGCSGERVIGAVPVYKIADSLCRLDAASMEPIPGASIVVPRENIFAVQTPQVFRLDVLKAAYELPYSESFTDDASVVREWLAVQGAEDIKIAYIAGERTNIKVTTPEDLALAKILM